MAEFIELATTDQMVVADMEAVTEAVKNPTAVRTEGLIVKEVDTAPLAVLMKKRYSRGENGGKGGDRGGDCDRIGSDHYCCGGGS